jgi:hypothetical protein
MGKPFLSKHSQILKTFYQFINNAATYAIAYLVITLPFITAEFESLRKTMQ